MAWSVLGWQTIAGLTQSFGDRREAQPDRVATLRQIHGCRVRHVGEARPKVDGDGLVTDRPGSLVGIWTADCVPVHVVARRARVAAALHCGWRGTAAGMIPTALGLLERRWNVTPREIEVALGPAIGGCCYEVGEEVRSAFISRAGGQLGNVGFTSREGQLSLDLREFLAAELTLSGVPSVVRVGPCTACRTDLLYSFRREGKTGRQLSWVGWQR